jgi:hypothetical protein
MFKVAFRLVYRIRGRCSRHPAYNPVKDEQAGIKGGCQECYGLFQAYRACLTLREAIGAFETTVHSFITTSRRAEGAGTSAHLCRRHHCDWRGGGARRMAMLSLQRCSVNQASENNEMFDSLAPTKGILLGLLISTLFWTLGHLELRQCAVQAVGRRKAGHFCAFSGRKRRKG